MKFRFVGGLDCPDWVLQGIASLSKLTVIKFKHWCSKCVDNILSEKEWNDDEIALLCPDTTAFDVENVKAMLATLSFIIEKAAKYNCCAENLELEMQQLGLPPEHCKQLFKVYSSNLENLHKILTANVKKGPSITSLKGSVLESSGQNKRYLLEFTSTAGEDVSIVMEENKLNFLYKELSEALQLVSKYTKNV